MRRRKGELSNAGIDRQWPPTVAPQRTGFGTKLLEVAVPTAEKARFDYSAKGFVYEIAVVLDSIHSKLKLPTKDPG
jgi:hypothetical protein